MAVVIRCVAAIRSLWDTAAAGIVLSLDSMQQLNCNNYRGQSCACMMAALYYAYLGSHDERLKHKLLRSSL